MTEQEIERMVADNEKLVYFTIRTYYPSAISDEDAVQAGRIGLWKACLKYDPSKGSFSTFAVSRIRSEIVMEYRGRARYRGPRDVVPLDEPLFMDGMTGHGITPAGFMASEEAGYLAVDYDLSFLEGKLSKRDMEIFRMSIRGFTTVEIGRTFGFTRASASAVIKKARQAAKEAFGYGAARAPRKAPTPSAPSKA